MCVVMKGRARRDGMCVVMNGKARRDGMCVEGQSET